MQISLLRISHQISVFAKSFLILILVFIFTAAYAQKTTEIKHSEAYTQALKNGDKLLQKKDYLYALKEYERALNLDPSQKYPQEKIAQIEKTLSDSQLSNALFESSITSGEKYFAAKDYKNAKTEYLNALRLDPEAQYPKDRLAGINKVFTDPEDEALYSIAVKSGDKAFDKTEYDEAVGFYKQALVIKPGDKALKNRIADAGRLKEELAVKQDVYTKSVVIADNLLEQKKYPEARAEFAKASATLPGESYPVGKIAIIDQELTALKAADNAYEAIIEEADKRYIARDFDNARILYQQALNLRPGERYPKSMLEKTGMGQSEVQTIRERFDEAIANANKDFAVKNYQEAITGYQAALALKPAEKYPQEKITLINGILGNQNSAQEKYDNYIKAADQAFSEQNYALALTVYQSGLGLRPAETYPKGKISEINVILDTQKSVREKYGNAIADADKFFTEKKYTQATDGYLAALVIKPNEVYPQDQITLIFALISKLKVLDENYNKVIAGADKAFNEKDYLLALTSYQSALNLKPGETYPQEKINAINAFFAQDKAKAEQRYAEYITRADGDFAKQNYSDARSFYQQASLLKPSEVYPKDKLTEISNLLLARTKEMKDAYDRIIADADKAYASRVFDQAIDFYENALAAKPDESYPVEMIAKIKKYMAEHSIVNLTKETFILLNNTEKRYSFKPLEAGLRKNNYVVLKARSPGGSKPKVYLNYGRDNARNGGIVLRSITSNMSNDFIIRISVQDKWYREDNNWLSLYSEGGDIEISSIQIAQGN